VTPFAALTPLSWQLYQLLLRLFNASASAMVNDEFYNRIRPSLFVATPLVTSNLSKLRLKAEIFLLY
jgi:hypothetical protein